MASGQIAELVVKAVLVVVDRRLSAEKISLQRANPNPFALNVGQGPDPFHLTWRLCSLFGRIGFSLGGCLGDLLRITMRLDWPGLIARKLGFGCFAAGLS